MTIKKLYPEMINSVNVNASSKKLMLLLNAYKLFFKFVMHKKAFYRFFLISITCIITQQS